MKSCVPKVPNIHELQIFQHTFNSPIGSACQRNKKQCPYFSGFQLGCCDHIKSQLFVCNLSSQPNGKRP